MKTNIRKDLIEEEFSKYKPQSYTPFKLTKKEISKLFNHYDCKELTIHFYDSDPKISKEVDEKMHCYYLKDFSVYSKEECKKSIKEYNELCREYNNTDERLRKLTWIDVYGLGIWDMTQDDVNCMAWNELKKSLSGQHSNKGRYYIAKLKNEMRNNKDTIIIYYYSRDIKLSDVWYIFERIDKKRR